MMGILFNSEAWHVVSDAEIKHIEKVHEALLMGLLKEHAKIALENKKIKNKDIKYSKN